MTAKVSFQQLQELLAKYPPWERQAICVHPGMVARVRELFPPQSEQTSSFIARGAGLPVYVDPDVPLGEIEIGPEAAIREKLKAKGRW